jgi:aminoglycoside phosphotransferase (APT) family kinase protein
LGKPEGYVSRQVEGWIDRYFKSKTNEIEAIENTAKWLQVSLPPTGKIAFIHNDFKYDNLILDPSEIGNIRAVLDWEMATVGDPLMDLGTSLAYWTESNDADIFKMFNLSYLPGNYTRQEIIAYYAQKSGADLSHILFYYVFGLFKVAVIAQQIYKRYQQGHSDDIRFAALIEVVIEAGNRAQKSIQTSII